MSATDRDDQAGDWASKCEEWAKRLAATDQALPLPGAVRINSDGTPVEAADMLSMLPLRLQLVADISPQHKKAICDSADGHTQTLICLQPHVRMLCNPDWGDQFAALPVLMVSLYLRGAGGPIHRPLHWIATPTEASRLALPQLADAAYEFLDIALSNRQFEMEAGLAIFGGDASGLVAWSGAIPRTSSLQFANCLRLAAEAPAQGMLDTESWQVCRDEAVSDLLPTAKRRQCIREMTHVAMAHVNNARCDVRGGQVQSWLIDNGWLHPQQIGGEA